jgi:NAD(P)-dependent dehydrogenase (short-subunit alcohol dehydrogenase family)
MSDFSGKIVLVTGATSGIGRGASVAFAEAGATVLVAGRRQVEGYQTLSLVEAAGGGGAFFPLDVAAEDQVAGVVERILSDYGRLDFAVNCAGINPTAPFWEYTEADYRKIFDTNVKGTFLCLKHEILAMRSTGGVIVNVGSIAGQRALRLHALYNASKSAASMLTRTAALEAAEFGIRVNELSPGSIDTPMLRSLWERETGDSPVGAQAIISATPLKRFGTPSEAASAILYLCSPGAGFVTGASLTMDGGLSLAI